MKRTFPLLSLLILTGGIGIANSSDVDPPCKPLDPKAEYALSYVTETQDVNIFVGPFDTEEYALSIIGPCRTRYMNGASSLNCLYITHSNFYDFLSLIRNNNATIRKFIVINHELDISNIPDPKILSDFNVLWLSGRDSSSFDSVRDLGED